PGEPARLRRGGERPAGVLRKLGPIALEFGNYSPVPKRTAAMRPRTLTFTIAALLLAAFSACASDDSPAPPLTEGRQAGNTAEEEKVLTDAKLASDGPSLLEFFRKRVLSAKQLERIDALIAQLGDEDFRHREHATAELKSLGTAALAR